MLALRLLIIGVSMTWEELLQKKLDIAINSLKDISVSLWDEMECRGCATQALKEIDEVLDISKGWSMTWEELKEKAKKMGAEIIIRIIADRTIEKIIFNNVAFYSDGGICGVYEREDGSTYCGSAFTQDRTPEQMLAIMKALQ